MINSVRVWYVRACAICVNCGVHLSVLNRAVDLKNVCSDCAHSLGS